VLEFRQPEWLGGATLSSSPALAAGAKSNQTPYIQEVYVDVEARSLVILGEGFGVRGRGLAIELDTLGGRSNRRDRCGRSDGSYGADRSNW